VGVSAGGGALRVTQIVESRRSRVYHWLTARPGAFGIGAMICSESSKWDLSPLAQSRDRKMTSRPRVTFLFGSGVSISAGYPRTDEITETIFRGERIHRHTDGRYYVIPNAEADYNDSDVEINIEILKIIKSLIEESDAHVSLRPINYEDIYFILSQLIDNESGDYENIVVQCFSDILGSGLNHNQNM
jgi:hypothetical protein